MKKLKIALYVRVSTEDQKVDLQLDALRQYAESRNIEIFKEYIDHISGSKSSRPALDELMADARRKRFKAVVVFKVDRLGRSVAHLLHVLTELQVLEVDFVSLQEAIDTGTPAGKMVFTFLGAVAEFERAIISERVKAGMAAAKKRGKHCGRPKLAFDIELVKRLRLEGYSLREISKRTDISISSLSRKLS
jgi:DNA invertase Pin-like site-specific DNA recombinase